MRTMWWYAQAAERVGPIDLDALKARMQDNVITADSFVWKEGLAAWTRVRDLEELLPLLRSVPPPLPPESSARMHSAEPDVVNAEQQQPAQAITREVLSSLRPPILDAPASSPAGRWSRFFARLFDMWWESLAVVAVGFIGMLVWVSSGHTVPQSSLASVAYGLAVLPLALVLDGLVYKVFGNTPGKSLLGLRVTDESGMPLLAGPYLGRNIGVWMSGLCLGLPLASFFALLYQGHQVKKTGMASYDVPSGSVVHLTGAGFLKKAVFVLLFGCLLVVIGALNAIVKTYAPEPNGGQAAAQTEAAQAPTAEAPDRQLQTAAQAYSPPSADGVQCNPLFVGGHVPAFINAKLATRATYFCESGFAVMYSGVTRTPLWSAEHLTPADVAVSAAPIDTQLHLSVKVPAEDRSEASDFRQSGYKAQPLTPAADFVSVAGIYDAVSYANAVPMHEGPVLDYWRNMEISLRRRVISHGGVYIINGAMFEGANLQILGGRVLVPTAYYRAIYEPSTRIAAAYIVENTAEAHHTVISLAELEARTGISLFPGLPPSIKQTVAAPE